MIKTLSNVLKQDKEKFIVPRKVQDMIPVQAIWPDGIFLNSKGKYSKMYRFTDINYAVASREDKEGMFLEYSELLNSLDSGSTMLIENMISSRGSMGCYQQGMNTGYIKWICFDFDCKDKSSPKVKALDGGIVRSLTDVLDSLGISYLKEFSGRRGIHIWVIFDCIIKKRTGYIIEQEILRLAQIRENPENEWGLDLFPATDSSRGNKVGKQVKFPLSSHKNGGMSYFFCIADNVESWMDVITACIDIFIAVISLMQICSYYWDMDF